ncbi:NADH:flavin oxidoreductase, partial [Candidatus Poribacteria bacterium]|nr:NADH:flavin oxidoreductase [Candidatus Poribacteria bacterium]
MSKLFEPKNLGNINIKNRLVRSATAEGASDEDGQIRDEIIDIYRDLASGGVGLIITGHAYVHPPGRCSVNQMGIHRDELMPGLHRITDCVHSIAPECKIAVQLSHAGRQAAPNSVSDPVAPSSVKDTATGITPREMTEDEILECIGCFADSAERVKKCGFDGVQLHGAHGYLISSFNSPHTNRRADKWGGTPENRMRFVVETYRSVRKKVGDDFPVFIKLNAYDFVDGGIEIEESSRIAAVLAQEGIDGIEVSGGMYESYRGKGVVRMRIRKPKQEAYFLPYAEKIKQAVGDVPVMLVGGIRSTSVMNEILDNGYADFISLCRPLIREADLPNKIKQN